MKRLLVMLILSAMLLSGCRSSERVSKSGSIGNYFVICIDGVEYLEKAIMYQGYAMPHYKPDGTLYTCEKGN